MKKKTIRFGALMTRRPKFFPPKKNMTFLLDARKKKTTFISMIQLFINRNTIISWHIFKDSTTLETIMFISKL